MSKQAKWKMKDRELVKQYQQGDRNAFDELVKRHYPQTYRLFHRMAGDAMLADDLCQETYIRVYRGLKRFRFRSEFTTWLYRISINVANNHFRREKIKKLFFSEKEYEGSTDTDESFTEQTDHNLWQAIQKLPRKQRMVIIFRIFQQLPFKDVADVIGISENSAKVNYHYAIKNLKGQLSVGSLGKVT